ncbi:MAG: hypothetical protein KAT71_00585 [Gammaproteobacteria bacterium]|nr:hypothetical protein [Gammaproteobacteria bacterium]
MQKKELSAAAKQYKREACPLFAVVHNKTADEAVNTAIFGELVAENTSLVYATNNIGTPILYEAFLYRRLGMAEILLQNGADSDLVCDFLQPPRLLFVDVAAAADLAFIRLFLSYEAPIDKEVNGLSVKKILENPSFYLKTLFKGYDWSPGAQKFLKNVDAIKLEIEKLKPQESVITDNPGCAAALVCLRNRSGLSKKPDAAGLVPGAAPKTDQDTSKPGPPKEGESGCSLQ